MQGVFMGIFHSVGTVVSEIWQNKVRLFRLARYELKSQHGGTFFGFLWNFLNPALQILVYWFVFAVGLRRGNDMNGVPYIVWLVIGIICWYYMNQAMLGADMSIINFSDVLKRMRFPIAIVPVKTVAANFITHICSMVIVFVVVLASGTPISTSVWLLPYYIFASTIFITGYALISSTINVLFRDFHNFSNTAFRFLFFISPVMWEPSDNNRLLVMIMKLNPFAYILNGYRDTILYGWHLADNIDTGLIFWAITIVMFVAGCVLHMRLRHKFIDML